MFFCVHLTSGRLSGTKLLLAYESSSEQSSECVRKHVCLAVDVCVCVCVCVCELRTECTGLLCMYGGYGKGCKFSGAGRLLVESFLKSVHG